MSLKGSLQTIALPEVLQLLSTTGKSGGLHVVGDDGDGRLWFVDGRMTAFSVGSAEEAFEAVFELLRVPTGDFSFAVDEEAPADAVAVEGGADVSSTLDAAQDRLVEWQEITEVVPSLDHHVELVSDAPGDPVSMSRSQWELVVAVGDGRAVREVLDRVALRTFEGCRAVRQSVEAGLIAVSEPVVASVTPLTSLSVVADAPAEAVDFAPDDEMEPEADFAPAEADEPAPLAEAAQDADLAPVDAEEPVVEDHFVEPAADTFVDVDALPGSMLRFGVDTSADADAPATETWSVGAFGAFGHPVAEDMPVVEEQGEEAGEPARPSFADFFAPRTGADEAVAEAHVEDEAPAEVDDRYAALRAAMLEAHDSDGEVADYSDEEAPVAHQYEIGTEPDSRAALEALLSEVRGEEEAAYDASGTAGWTAEGEAPVYEPFDGLADRGPWTDNELASMEPQPWVAPVAEEAPAEVVAFGAPEMVAEEPAAEAVAAEQGDEPQAAPAEEPMNRGLLLKFLSSVRN